MNRKTSMPRQYFYPLRSPPISTLDETPDKLSANSPFSKEVLGRYDQKRFVVF